MTSGGWGNVFAPKMEANSKEHKNPGGLLLLKPRGRFVENWVV